jgi:hypothetical protein
MPAGVVHLVLPAGGSCSSCSTASHAGQLHITSMPHGRSSRCRRRPPGLDSRPLRAEAMTTSLARPVSAGLPEGMPPEPLRWQVLSMLLLLLGGKLSASDFCRRRSSRRQRGAAKCHGAPGMHACTCTCMHAWWN